MITFRFYAIVEEAEYPLVIVALEEDGVVTP
jgi:hypothetical protein